MKKHPKYIERRTFLQDRFEILIKRQKAGIATFAELTELDEIVNRDPEIRFSILEEMEGENTPDSPMQDDFIVIQQPKTQTLLEKMKIFISHLFKFSTQSLQLV